MARELRRCTWPRSRGTWPIVTLLVERGADVSAEDDLHHATPIAWAEHSQQTACTNYLLSR